MSISNAELARLSHNRSEQRRDAAYATLTALSRIHSGWTTSAQRHDTIHGRWGFLLTTPGSQFSIREVQGITSIYRVASEDELGTTLDSVLLADPGHVAKMIVSTLTGKTVIPAESRRQVRDVIAAARTNATYHFRVGMNAILDADSLAFAIADWAELDDGQRWNVIEESYVSAASVPPQYMGFMPGYRTLGIPMQVRDIYEEAYQVRATELLDTVTHHEVRS